MSGAEGLSPWVHGLLDHLPPPLLVKKDFENDYVYRVLLLRRAAGPSKAPPDTGRRKREWTRFTVLVPVCEAHRGRWPAYGTQAPVRLPSRRAFTVVVSSAHSLPFGSHAPNDNVLPLPRFERR